MLNLDLDLDQGQESALPPILTLTPTPTSTLTPRQAAQLYDSVTESLIASSLRHFIKHAWSTLEPGRIFNSNWHIDCISEHLEACYPRRQIRNLAINIPPRCMKSLSVSVFWPMWVWTFNPYIQWLYASYAEGLSVRDSLKCRDLVKSPFYQARWSQVFQLSSDQNLKHRFNNSRNGYRIASSITGTITGDGGDIIVVDDPHKIQEADTPIRESVINTWSNTFSTRANDPQDVIKVIVMQRVHQRDLTGFLLETEYEDWHHLCLPLEYTHEKYILIPSMPVSINSSKTPEQTLADFNYKTDAFIQDLNEGRPSAAPPLPVTPENSNSIVKTPETEHYIGPHKGCSIYNDPRTIEGESLWKTRYGPLEIAIAKRMGDYEYSGQMQERPSPPGGGILQPAYIKPLPLEFDVILPNDTKSLRQMLLYFQYWDTAFSSRREADYTVGLTLGIDLRLMRLFITDIVRVQVDKLSIMPVFVHTVLKNKPRMVGVEKPAFQQPFIELLINTAQKELAGRLATVVQGIDISTDKLFRARITKLQLEQGNVYADTDAIWYPQLKSEMEHFPRGEHDDQVDALSGAIQLALDNALIVGGTIPINTSHLPNINNDYSTGTGTGTGRLSRRERIANRRNEY